MCLISEENALGKEIEGLIKFKVFGGNGYIPPLLVLPFGQGQVFS